MPKVFISHATADRQEFVSNLLLPLLDRHDIDHWLCSTEIQATAEWEREIQSGLRACDWFLVVVSQSSQHSKWVQREVAWAVEHRDGKIIPVRIDATNPADLHLALGAIHFVDFLGGCREVSSQLLAIWGIQQKTLRADPMEQAIEDTLRRVEEAGAAAELARNLETLRTGDSSGIDVLIEHAESGDVAVQHHLAVYFETNSTPDIEQAIRWFRAAAQQGHCAGQFHLGRHYEKDVNFEEASLWYKKSAAQGFAPAQFALAELYAEGKGVPQDTMEAVIWYRLAGKQGVTSPCCKPEYIP